jgi:hypothetical protein
MFYHKFCFCRFRKSALPLEILYYYYFVFIINSNSLLPVGQYNTYYDTHIMDCRSILSPCTDLTKLLFYSPWLLLWLLKPKIRIFVFWFTLRILIVLYTAIYTLWKYFFDWGSAIKIYIQYLCTVEAYR